GETRSANIKNTRGWLRIYLTCLSTFVVGYCRGNTHQQKPASKRCVLDRVCCFSKQVWLLKYLVVLKFTVSVFPLFSRSRAIALGTGYANVQKNLNLYKEQFLTH
uniref:hypothetical protein n=1 Tax=Hassallia byssoidea TaxID=482630 RepID=UPI001F3100CF